MSELINANRHNNNIHRNLLANVSALALLGYLGASTGAHATSADEDHPIVWVELGGQFERSTDESDMLSPPFFSHAEPAYLAVLTGVQQPPPFTTGFDGKISLTPEDSNWVFSGAIRYGRSSTVKHLNHQGGLRRYQVTLFGNERSATASKEIFADALGNARESHAILDFQAGKDVGLGLFGNSVVSAGVRFAQFTASDNASIHARPQYTLVVKTLPGKYKNFPVNAYRQTYTAVVHTKRNAQGIGPSLSWDASAAVLGNSSSTSLNFDWGVNAAILFGRQRTQVHHQTTGHSYSRTGRILTGIAHRHSTSYTHGPYDHSRSRTVTIPNVGGFAGITVLHGITKISMGYRADFFFHAMDNGIDTRKSETLGFYGPFATISIGLGG